MTSLTKTMDVDPPQLSVAITFIELGTGTWLAHQIVIFGGHIIDGGVWSFTNIDCVQVAEFPHKSIALYTRVIVYRFAHV